MAPAATLAQMVAIKYTQCVQTTSTHTQIHIRIRIHIHTFTDCDNKHSAVKRQTVGKKRKESISLIRKMESSIYLLCTCATLMNRFPVLDDDVCFRCWG